MGSFCSYSILHSAFIISHFYFLLHLSGHVAQNRSNERKLRPWRFNFALFFLQRALRFQRLISGHFVGVTKGVRRTPLSWQELPSRIRDSGRCLRGGRNRRWRILHVASSIATDNEWHGSKRLPRTEVQRSGGLTRLVLAASKYRRIARAVYHPEEQILRMRPELDGCSGLYSGGT